MLDQLLSVFAQLGAFARPVGWVALAIFLVAIALEYVDREYARPVYVAGWIVFALFWLLLIHPFFVKDDSFIRGIGAVLAVPTSLLVAKVLYSGRNSLFTLSRAIVFMGLIYAPFLLIEVLREQLILIVTGHTQWAMSLIGYDPPLVTELSEARPYVPEGLDPNLDREIGAKERPYENTFVFFKDDGGTITYSILLACTGIGSMSVLAGLILAVRAPIRRKARALALSLPIIYVLNIVRNVFIGLSFGHQYAHFFPEQTMWLFGLEKSLKVSYIWADRIMAQSASVVAMVAIFWLVVHELPEVMDPVEDVLYLLTGTEYDLAEALRVETAASSEPAD